MENKIKHVGVVQAIDNGRITVRIVQSSACASCKAVQQCHAAESKEKTVFVYTDSTEYFVGQDVVVMASYKVGFTAVCLSMLIPMLLMMIVLFLMTTLGYTELFSALTCVGLLIPYYILLYLFRKQINKRVSFSIQKHE